MLRGKRLLCAWSKASFSRKHRDPHPVNRQTARTIPHHPASHRIIFHPVESDHPSCQGGWPCRVVCREAQSWRRRECYRPIRMATWGKFADCAENAGKPWSNWQYGENGNELLALEMDCVAPNTHILTPRPVQKSAIEPSRNASQRNDIRKSHLAKDLLD